MTMEWTLVDTSTVWRAVAVAVELDRSKEWIGRSDMGAPVGEVVWGVRSRVYVIVLSLVGLRIVGVTWYRSTGIAIEKGGCKPTGTHRWSV